MLSVVRYYGQYFKTLNRKNTVRPLESILHKGSYRRNDSVPKFKPAWLALFGEGFRS